MFVGTMMSFLKKKLSHYDDVDAKAVNFWVKKKSRLKNLMGTLIPKYGAVLLLSLSGLLDLLPLYSFTSPIKNILLLSFFK